MSEALVLCGPIAPSSAEAKAGIRLDVSPHAPEAHRVKFSSDTFRARFGDDLPDVLADAVELAVYVFSADRLVRRGAGGSGIGAEWQRKLNFKVAVRRPEIWNRADVGHALQDVLGFLSGDQISFEFVQTQSPAAIEGFLGFNDPSAQVIRPDQVILFSGGLDSLAGVAEQVIGAGARAVLVTHTSSKAIMPRQADLFTRLKARSAAGSIFHAPITVRRGLERPAEASQRLRSFLFATLGMAHAAMFGLRKIHFFENGITSINLPVAEHVVGTRASRTTHPKVLAGFGKLFSLLLQEPVTFENPFLWKTKADILSIIAENGCADLIVGTTSCARVHRLAITGVQCGCCSQCVERQLAVRAADLSEYEDPAAYAADMFIGEFENPLDIMMIIGHVLRAQRLVTMSKQQFEASYGQVFRVGPYVGLPPERALEEIHELHHRYGVEVMRVADAELARHSSVAAALTRPPNSLISLLNSPHGLSASWGMPISPSTDPASEPAQSGVVAIGSTRIILSVDEMARRIEFEGGPVLCGAAYSVVKTLANLHLCDRASGIHPKDYARISSKLLAKQLEITEERLRQTVLRLREELAAQFEATTGDTIDRNALIESRPWQGYRLNPYVHIISRTTPAGTDVTPSGTGVTTRPAED